MGNIAKLTPTKDPLAFVSEGFHVWTPAKANKVFSECRYERNRNEAQAKRHIDALARQMTDGTWLAKSPIDFARTPDGKLTLVNGHHRMLAQVQAGKDIEWSVSIHECADEAEVADLFWRFDTILRKRSNTNVMNAVNAAGTFGLSKTTTMYLPSAVTFIDFGMRAPTGANSKVYTPAEKLALMDEWQAEARIYDELVAVAPGRVRRKLLGAQVFAVALLTLRSTPKVAVDFWQGVAADDGLNRGDPRKTLIDFLRDTHGASTGLTSTAAAAARAWNAHYAGRQLSMMRVGSAPVRIAGTKVSVSP